MTATLRALKLKGYLCWRNNSSLQVIAAEGKSRRRVIKGGEAGSPDIFVVLPVVASMLSLGADGMKLESASYGALCGVEMKTDKGRQSASQKAWESRATKHGVRYAVERTISGVLKRVEAWKAGGL